MQIPDPVCRQKRRQPVIVRGGFDREIALRLPVRHRPPEIIGRIKICFHIDLKIRPEHLPPAFQELGLVRIQIVIVETLAPFDWINSLRMIPLLYLLQRHQSGKKRRLL